jgi:hypothetical protein
VVVQVPGFGDRVRIRSTSVTEAAGVAGLTGQVNGETTPSITSVAVIGEVLEDFALSIAFDRGGESQWFAPELVEFIDHGAGTEIRIGEKRWVRSAHGDWQPSDQDSDSHSWLQKLLSMKLKGRR